MRWALLQGFLTNLALVLSWSASPGQNQANLWYFGRYAGVDFNSGGPVAITDGNLSTREGCASICDFAGDLLFYTDGTTVYNQKHQTMENGDGLMGSPTSTQSALIVPQPGNDSLYYIFTVDAGAYSSPPNEGLRYSIVNVNANSGLGEVVDGAKNRLLRRPSCEKITAVRHKNGRDYWIISRDFGNRQYRCFKLSESGLAKNPVKSSLPINVMGNDLFSIGYLKVSRDGTRLAAAHYYMGTVVVMSFDSETGKITYDFEINGFFNDTPYGLEFSPDSRFLYVSQGFPASIGSQGFLFQFDLKNGLPENNYGAVELSRGPLFGALQLGPDEKIYASVYEQGFLASIQEPNKKGLNAGFKQQAVNLLGRGCQFGLPPFVQSFLLPAFKASGLCALDTTYFETQLDFTPDSVRWDYGDNSVPEYKKAPFSSKHVYYREDQFEVTLTAYKKGKSVSRVEQITTNPAYQINLGKDTILCAGQRHWLEVPASADSFAWKRFGDDPGRFAYPGDTAFLTAWDENRCKAEDRYIAHFDDFKIDPFPDDTVLCEGKVLSLINRTTHQALWMDELEQKTFKAARAGTYWLKLTNGNGCFDSDTLNLDYTVFRLPYLPSDTVICDGDSLLLNAEIAYPAQYKWDDGDSLPTKTLHDPGLYKVVVQYKGCEKSDSVTLVSRHRPYGTSLWDSTICLGDSHWVGSVHPESDYFWNDGFADQGRFLQDSGAYILTSSNGCGTAIDSFVITTADCSCQATIANAFTPNGDGINEGFRPEVACYLKSYRFEIYDRWGTRVFLSTNPEEFWDGRFCQELVVEDLYVWKLSYQGAGLRETTPVYRAGFVAVLR